MNKKILADLAKMEDVMFFVLEHHFQIARMVRNAMSKNGIDEKRMATILGVKSNQMKSVINGGYVFDLMLLSRLQSFLQEKAATDAKFQIETESIGFATYKNQYPLYVARIEKLLDILEKTHPPCQ